jgi:hypothetical protein
MNETISAALRDHADGDIHIERLLSAVHAGARRQRRRRLAPAGGAVVALVAMVGNRAARHILAGRPWVVISRPWKCCCGGSSMSLMSR